MPLGLCWTTFEQSGLDWAQTNQLFGCACTRRPCRLILRLPVASLDTPHGAGKGPQAELRNKPAFVEQQGIWCPPPGTQEAGVCQPTHASSPQSVQRKTRLAPLHFTGHCSLHGTTTNHASAPARKAGFNPEPLPEP